MALEKWSKDQIIHQKDTPVSSMEIVISGRIRMKDGDSFITLNAGSIIGLAEEMDEPYKYTYIAVEEASTYSYPFTGNEDVDKLIAVNQKIAPSITAQAILNANYFYQVLLAAFEDVKKRYERIIQDKKEYPMLCAEAGTKAKDFPELEHLMAPPPELAVPKWLTRFTLGVHENEDRFKESIYSMGPDICAGFVHLAMDLIQIVGKNLMGVRAYEEHINKCAGAFEVTVQTIRAKKDAIESGLADSAMPPMKNILSRLLLYADVSEAVAKEFNDAMQEYKRHGDRGGSSDELRSVRRKLTKVFYPVYEKALIRFFEENEAPPEVMMFLMFGFVDETICTQEQIRRLYGFAQAYRPDPNRRILTIAEWLYEIYQMNVEPSRNEFDQDYPTFLRESRMNGDISEEQEYAMLKDPKSRLHFELSNLFTIGNRMTFGRISLFNPVFDDCNVIVPLEKGYVTRERVKEVLDHIRSIDYRCFYRYEYYSDEERGVNHITIHKEKLPYIILMPNVGGRAVLWQEIDGKKKSSPGRMLLPIFMTDDLTDQFIRVCGEFRWEMCKTEQGIHWNDIHDPSLTSEYYDYLQFYRKNSVLNADYKEKVKGQLQKANNNFRNVFVADYLTYMKYESRAALRLNKVARDIIFKYCPFGREQRQALVSNPQYEQHIGKFANRTAQQKRPLIVLRKRLEHDGIPIPEELLDEIRYLEM